MRRRSLSIQPSHGEGSEATRPLSGGTDCRRSPSSSLAARLAGGFLQAVDSDGAQSAIAKAVTVDLLELNGIKVLPGFPRRVATTLNKAWTAGVDLTKLAKNEESAAARRIESLMLLEAEVLRHLPPSMRRPADLVAVALPRFSTRSRCSGEFGARTHRAVTGLATAA